MSRVAPEASPERMDRIASYGVAFSGPQHDYTTPEGNEYLNRVHSNTPLDWADKRLARVTCLRLLTDPGCPFWDVSYCHGVDVDGEPCRVLLPFGQLPRRGMKRAIVEAAQEDGVYAKGLGILSNISKLGAY